MKSKRQKYFCPKIEIIGIKVEYLMTEASGNHSGIGLGGTAGDAKRCDFYEENNEQEVSVNKNIWED
ncbi:MAG: hypothetical protein HG422_08260 [Prevotella sp.]|nr:hypothetical protein [Prevotella sp.]